MDEIKIVGSGYVHSLEPICYVAARTQTLSRNTLVYMNGMALLMLTEAGPPAESGRALYGGIIEVPKHHDTEIQQFGDVYWDIDIGAAVNSPPVNGFYIGMSINYISPVCRHVRVALNAPRKSQREGGALPTQPAQATQSPVPAHQPAQNQATQHYVCPACNAQLVPRSGAFGPFWGCSGFPECKFKTKYPEDYIQNNKENTDDELPF